MEFFKSEVGFAQKLHGFLTVTTHEMPVYYPDGGYKVQANDPQIQKSLLEIIPVQVALDHFRNIQVERQKRKRWNVDAIVEDFAFFVRRWPQA